MFVLLPTYVVANEVSELVLLRTEAENAEPEGLEIWPQNSKIRETRHVSHTIRENFSNQSFISIVSKYRRTNTWF